MSRIVQHLATVAVGATMFAASAILLVSAAPIQPGITASGIGWDGPATIAPPGTAIVAASARTAGPIGPIGWD